MSPDAQRRIGSLILGLILLTIAWGSLHLFPFRVTVLGVGLSLLALVAGAALAWANSTLKRGIASLEALAIKTTRYSAVGLALCMVASLVSRAGGNVIAAFLGGAGIVFIWSATLAAHSAPPSAS